MHRAWNLLFLVCLAAFLLISAVVRHRERGQPPRVNWVVAAIGVLGIISGIAFLATGS